jgi:hypothetical protein
MANMKTQMDIVVEMFEKLRHIVETTPCSIEAEIAVADLEVELIELGLDIKQ